MLLHASVGAHAPAQDKYWIYFRDKGDYPGKSIYSKVESNLNDHARERRARVSHGPFLIDDTDLPIAHYYNQILRQNGITPIVCSKWLNAVSALLDPGQVKDVKSLPFVSRIHKVNHFYRDAVEYEHVTKSALGKKYLLDYGESLTQNNLSNIPPVHNQGIFGQNVRVAIFDTGFRLTHQVFQRIKVISTYDFINHDTIVDNESGQDNESQNFHGTAILSIIAGYWPGYLIGPAFDAEYLLAKTEDVRSETPVEEDNWIAAVEWADSLGADIISSSLGYMDWYSYEDMDGNTAPITIAADLAVKKGIVVVTSAGNEGDKRWKYITAPADGDSVITVGAVQPSGIIAGFSSQGPTSDGRIKPDVLAMGVGVTSVTTSQDTGPVRISGTSASCPIVAGIAALILSAHPDLTPMQIREALVNTADRADNPDNIYGYGLANALAAVQYWGKPPDIPASFTVAGVYPNPFSLHEYSVATLQMDIVGPAQMTVEIYNVLGEKVKTLWHGVQPTMSHQQFAWDGRTDDDSPVASGAYFYIIHFRTRNQTVPITVLN
jgi:serine protease AprX